MEVYHFIVEYRDCRRPVAQAKEQFLCLEVDLVGRVDGLGCTVDFVSAGHAAAEFGAVLDVVDSGLLEYELYEEDRMDIQERCIMSHGHCIGNELGGLLINLIPHIKGIQKLSSNLLARNASNIVIWFSNNLHKSA